MWWNRLRGWVLRFTTRRYRRVLIASAITLLVSATLLGLTAAVRWRGRQALHSDTGTTLAQTGEQLVRSLVSRRGTLTLVRDTLKRRADLTPPQLKALGRSAVEHTRHMLGAGLARADQPPVWWAGPDELAARQTAELNRAIGRRARLRGVWRVPSTFVAVVDGQGPLLVMLEPIPASGSSAAVMGVFDLKPLLSDFFTSGTVQGYPAQVLDGSVVLYQSPDWVPATPERTPVIAKETVRVDAAEWVLQMQPGSSRVAQTLSSVNLLLIGLSALAGLGVTVIVWILAARTWILQRAVNRRTAALRRSRERLRLLATTDELTGLYNRRFFLNRLQWECDRAKRYQRPLACLMIDVNGFKQVNDKLGHLIGDTVLKQVAEELKTLLRQSDILARFGGDEFIIALPETSYAQAASVAEKLRQIAIPVAEGTQKGVPEVSLSVGVSQIAEARESPRDILEAADQSLYAHKQHAKNRVRRHIDPGS
jgi:diguanylate cyclase (GGDEF)-like protein